MLHGRNLPGVRWQPGAVASFVNMGVVEPKTDAASKSKANKVAPEVSAVLLKGFPWLGTYLRDNAGRPNSVPHSRGSSRAAMWAGLEHRLKMRPRRQMQGMQMDPL